LLRQLAFVGVVILCAPRIATQPACATETDQFTLPDAPLKDIGPDISAKTLEILGAEIAKVNEKIAKSRRKDPSAVTDEERIAEDIYDRVGIGIPESTMELYARHGEFRGKSVRFQPSYFNSVYSGVMSPLPFALIFIMSPTIRVHGVDMGTDKIGHLFQQGFEYFHRYQDARGRGADEAAAIDLAVQYGVATEDGLYGVVLAAVYSNGDLAANYAGFKFYCNLFNPVKIGDEWLAPIILRDGVYLRLNPERANSDLLKPYISEHLNEAYNPSEYVWGVDLIRRHVRDRCERWFKDVAEFNEATYRDHLEHAKTWHGEAYGWELPERYAATLLECFKPREARNRGLNPRRPGRAEMRLPASRSMSS